MGILDLTLLDRIRNYKNVLNGYTKPTSFLYKLYLFQKYVFPKFYLWEIEQKEKHRLRNTNK